MTDRPSPGTTRPAATPRHPDQHTDARTPSSASPGRATEATAAGGGLDLRAVLARARTAERPGPDTDPGPRTPDWPGEPHCIPQAGPGELDLWWLLRLSLAATDADGRRRPAPSAGGCHPVDAQVVVGDGCPVPPGRYGYQPLTHRLHRLAPAPEATPPGATVELHVTVRRTAGHYGHRAWPLALLDTGHAVAALQLAARSLGVRSTPTGLDGTSAAPLATVRCAPPTAAGRPSADQNAPTARQLLARRSAEPPLTGEPDRHLLRDVLAAAAHGAGDLGWCLAVGPPDPHLLTLDSEGALRRLATGDARPTLAAWAAGQGWLADAGAVLLAHGCPDDATDAEITGAHLKAGYGVGLALFAATAAGLRTRPVGSWQQADIGAALGRPHGTDWIVHGLVLAAPDPATAAPPDSAAPADSADQGPAAPERAAPPPQGETDR